MNFLMQNNFLKCLLLKFQFSVNRSNFQIAFGLASLIFFKRSAFRVHVSHPVPQKPCIAGAYNSKYLDAIFADNFVIYITSCLKIFEKCPQIRSVNIVSCWTSSFQNPGVSAKLVWPNVRTQDSFWGTSTSSFRVPHTSWNSSSP